jgi:hypothetical protein
MNSIRATAKLSLTAVIYPAFITSPLVSVFAAWAAFGLD